MRSDCKNAGEGDEKILIAAVAETRLSRAEYDKVDVLSVNYKK